MGQYYGLPLKDQALLKNDFRKFLVQILGGAIVVFGLFVAYRRVKVMEDGQITEHFTRAIDQLGARNQEGSPNLEVRLGAIYALERIS